MLNKFVKFLAYAGAHILVSLEVYILAFIVTGPVLGLVYGIMDVINKVPELIRGRYLIVWVLASVVTWIIMLVYVELKTHGLTKKDK